MERAVHSQRGVLSTRVIVALVGADGIAQPRMIGCISVLVEGGKRWGVANDHLR